MTPGKNRKVASMELKEDRARPLGSTGHSVICFQVTPQLFSEVIILVAKKYCLFSDYYFSIQ